MQRHAVPLQEPGAGVSILTRPERPDATTLTSDDIARIGVSILTRPEGRMQPPSPARARA